MNPRRLTRRVGNGFEQVDVLGPTRGCCQTWRPRRPGRGRGSQRPERPAADAVVRAIRRRGRCAKLGPGVVLAGERAATRCASPAGTVIRSAGVSYVRHTARRNVPNKRSCPAGAEHPSSSPRVAADYWTPACPIADRRSPGDPEHVLHLRRVAVRCYTPITTVLRASTDSSPATSLGLLGSPNRGQVWPRRSVVFCAPTRGRADLWRGPVGSGLSRP